MIFIYVYREGRQYKGRRKRAVSYLGLHSLHLCDCHSNESAQTQSVDENPAGVKQIL